MKEIYFVTATNTDVGKSYACEIFLDRFAKDGKKVGYFKPIETGVEKLPLDGTKLLNIAQKLNPDFKVTIEDVVPFMFRLPAAPIVASGFTTIDIKKIKTTLNYLLGFCDVLIIEGAGGLMVPINRDYFMIDLIKDLKAKPILISPSNLGSINDTMLSLKLLDDYGLEYDWYINLYKDKDSFDTVTLPFYKAYFGDIKFLD